MTDQEKIKQIREIIKELREFYKDEDFPLSAWEDLYRPYMSAIGEIEDIVE